MTKTEHNRVLAWRLKLLREASMAPRSVAQTCRRYELSHLAAGVGLPSGRWSKAHRGIT